MLYRGRREQRVRIDSDAVKAAWVPSDVDDMVNRDAIDHALAGLDVDLREAFLLKHVEQLSYEEMSEATGLGVSALKMRVKRACDRLRVALGDGEGGVND
jgi:RNA polymerase sigma-70 factor (ECF subfamily)